MGYKVIHLLIFYVKIGFVIILFVIFNVLVLIQCSTLLFAEDCMLAMCHLLAVSNPALCKQCFSSLPRTSFTLQLTVYFYALVDALKYHTDAVYWKPDEV